MNLREIVHEVSAAFYRYESAANSNDVGAPDELFWNIAPTLRHGIGEAS